MRCCLLFVQVTQLRGLAGCARQSPAEPTNAHQLPRCAKGYSTHMRFFFFGRLVGWSTLQIIFSNPFQLINSLTAIQWTCLFHALCDPQPADPVSMLGRGPPHHLQAHNLAPHGPTRTNRHTNTNRTMSPQNYRSPIRQKTCWVFVWRILLLAELVSRNFLRIIKGCVLWNTTILASLLPRYHNHCAWL